MAKAHSRQESNRHAEASTAADAQNERAAQRVAEHGLQREARYGKGATRQYGGHYTRHPQVPEYPMRDVLAPRFGQRIQQIGNAETHLAGNQGQKTAHDNRRQQDGKTD